MKRADKPQDAPTRLTVALALGTFGAAVLLNLQHAALWTVPVALLAAIWRARASWQTHRMPGRMTKFALVSLLTLAVIASFRTLNGVAAGATLLVCMGSAKLLELRARRDGYVMVATSLFLLLAACLDAQQLWRVPLYALEFLALAACLQALGRNSRTLRLAPLLRLTSRAALLALPLAVLMFLFFPRLPGAFWAIPEEGQAITGLGEEMSPGSISTLSESDDPALRVRFDGALPAPGERYWRGPVLHDFDGYTWRRGGAGFQRAEALAYGASSYRYDLTLEANSHNVLVALELPEDPHLPGTFFTADYQLIAAQPTTQARTYSLVSHPGYRALHAPRDFERREDLALPRERNPRTLALAKNLRTRAGSDAAMVELALDYFRRGGFEYTLTPPKLSLDSVDDFIFNTHRGFCGHFASAFATLMRAAGIPARVVTGYLGGEWNPIGGYLTVRQSHAHAWDEVWLDDRGWVRVDPTAVVAPERLTRDIFDLNAGAVRSSGRVLREAPWIGRALQGWEALNAWWQDRVIGFNFAKQLSLLGRIGFGDADWQSFGLLLGGGSALWMLWLGWSLRGGWRWARPDALARAWELFCRRAARGGVERAAHEGPLAFAQRMAQSQPAAAAQIVGLARRYADLRYGLPAGDPSLHQQLVKDLRRFRAPQARA